MKYLKRFENHRAYEAAETSLILPNVSLCIQEHEVHYNHYVKTKCYDITPISGPCKGGKVDFTVTEKLCKCYDIEPTSGDCSSGTISFTATEKSCS